VQRLVELFGRHDVVDVPGWTVREIRRALSPGRVLIHRDEGYFLFADNVPDCAAFEACCGLGLACVKPNAMDWTDEACELWVERASNAADCASGCSLSPARLFLRDCRRLRSAPNTPVDYAPLKRIIKLLAMTDGMQSERLSPAIARLRQDCAVSMRLGNTDAVKAAALLLERSVLL
jgi:hypothetical protein